MGQAIRVTIALLALSLVGATGAVALSRSDGAGAPTGHAPDAAPAAPTAPGERPAVAPLPAGCTTVVVTPPTSPDDYHGDLCVPQGPHRDVAVVLVHGGGGYGGSRADMAGWAGVYQWAGYVTLSVDYLIFGQTTRSPVYPEPEQDVKAAVQYLRDHAAELGVGIDRIVVHGSSAGSRLGGQLYVSGDDPYFYGAEMWPTTPDHVNGFIGFYGYYSGLSIDEVRYYGGVESDRDPAVQERWAKANSIANAGGATGPSLLIHGQADTVVPAQQTERFAAALEAADADVTTKIVPGASHGFDVVVGGALTPAGEDIAHTVLDWLDHEFP